MFLLVFFFAFAFVHVLILAFVLVLFFLFFFFFIVVAIMPVFLLLQPLLIMFIHLRRLLFLTSTALFLNSNA